MPAKKTIRARGEGSIFSKKGNYYVKYTDPITGKRREKTLKTKDRREAERNLKVFMAERVQPMDETKVITALAKDHGIIDEAEIAETRAILNRNKKLDILLTDCFQAFVDDPSRVELKDSRINTYRGFWNKFLAFMTSTEQDTEFLHEVTTHVSKEFAQWLKTDTTFTSNKDKPVSPTTYNRTISFCKLLWNTLSLSYSLKANPFKHLSRLKLKTQSYRDLSNKELDLILKDTEIDPDLITLFYIGAYTGLRLKDCALLERSAIDRESNSIEVLPYKVRDRGISKTVRIPIIPPLLHRMNTVHPRDFDPVRDNIKKHESDSLDFDKFVLPSIASKYFRHQGNLSDQIKNVFEKYDIKSNSEGVVGFHSLRHTFVSICAKAGVQLSVVQSIVGHGSPKLTQHYTHIDLETTQRELRKLDIHVKPPALSSSKLMVKQDDPIMENQRLLELGKAHELCHGIAPEIVQDMSLLSQDFIIEVLEQMTSENWDGTRDVLLRSLKNSREVNSKPMHKIVNSMMEPRKPLGKTN